MYKGVVASGHFLHCLQLFDFIGQRRVLTDRELDQKVRNM